MTEVLNRRPPYHQAIEHAHELCGSQTMVTSLRSSGGELLFYPESRHTARTVVQKRWQSFALVFPTTSASIRAGTFETLNDLIALIQLVVKPKEFL